MNRLQSMQTRMQRSQGYPWLVFGSVVLGCVMVNVDSSILTVAVSTFEQTFATEIQQVQWVITAYLLVVTGLLPSIGKLSDIKGRKPMFLLGIALFSVSSVLCAMAVSLNKLVMFRILQAIGGALIMGNMMPLIASTFQKGQRGRAMGGISSVIAASTILGPPLGGFLITFFSWRSIFWVNVPIGLVSVISTWLLVPHDRKTQSIKKFDWLGAGVFFLAMASLLLYLSNGLEWGYASISSWVCLFTSLTSWVVFVWWQGRCSEPLVDLTVFRIPMFTLGNVTGYLGFILAMVPAITLPLLMDHVLHFEVHKIGLIMATQAIATILISPFSGWLTDRIGPRWPVWAGAGLIVAGLGMLINLNENTSVSWMVAALLVQGIGVGAFQSPNNLSVLESVPVEKMGAIGGIMATIRNFGRVTGASFSIVVLQLMTMNRMGDSRSYAEGISWVFILSCLLGGILFLFSLIMYWSPESSKTKRTNAM